MKLSPEAEREWQRQELALQQEREGRPAGGDAATQAYRLLARGLAQPLVPERVFLSGSPGGDTPTRSASEGQNGNGHGGAGATNIATTGLVGLLMQTLLAERTSFAGADNAELASLKDLTTRLTRETLANMPSCGAGVPPAATAKEIAVAN